MVRHGIQVLCMWSLLVWGKAISTSLSRVLTQLSSSHIKTPSTPRALSTEPIYMANIINDSIYVHRCNESVRVSLDGDTKLCRVELSHNAIGLRDDEPSCIRGHGIIGIYNVSNTSYLALISAYDDMYDINPYVKRITEITLVQLPGQKPGNKRELGLLQNALSSHSLYFSTHPHCYDVSLSTQQNFLRTRCQKSISSSPHFTWNNAISQPFLSNFSSWITPITNAVISSSIIRVDNSTYTLHLIARRSCHRQGTRFLKRGIDECGHVANFVEVEQILEGERGVASLVQIRGSLPLFWHHTSPWLWKPAIALNSSVHYHQNALMRHIRDISSNITRLSLLNLIDKMGVQGKLGVTLQQTLQSLNAQSYSSIALRRNETFLDTMMFPRNLTVQHVWYDFHHKYQNPAVPDIKEIEQILSMELQNNGYFLNATGEHRLQETLMRANCVDCLDRTNVMQAIIGCTALEDQLRMLGHRNGLSEEMRNVLRHMWVSVGDELSVLNTGTRALKTDLVLNRRRSVFGAIQDGSSALRRRHWNKYWANYRQKGVDILLGNV